jgi:hypothetical protein
MTSYMAKNLANGLETQPSRVLPLTIYNRYGPKIQDNDKLFIQDMAANQNRCQV